MDISDRHGFCGGPLRASPESVTTRTVVYEGWDHWSRLFTATGRNSGDPLALRFPAPRLRHSAGFCVLAGIHSSCVAGPAWVVRPPWSLRSGKVSKVLQWFRAKNFIGRPLPQWSYRGCSAPVDWALGGEPALKAILPERSVFAAEKNGPSARSTPSRRVSPEDCVGSRRDSL